MKISATAKLNLWLARRLFKRSASARADLFRTISYYLDSFQLEQTLEALANHRLKRQEMYGFMIESWLNELRGGRDLQAVLSDWLPADEASLISANARQSQESKGFELASLLAESKQKMSDMMITELAQPVVALTLLCVVMGLFSLSIIPKIVANQETQNWPWAGKAVVAVSDFLVAYWPIILTSLLGVIILVGYSLARLRPDTPFIGWLRMVIDHLPPYNVYKSMQSASFLLSLSALLQAGTELRQAISQLNLAASPYLKFYLKRMDVELRRGNYLIISNAGLMDREVANLLADFMQLSQSFDHAVQQVGKRTVEMALRRVKRLSLGLSAFAGLAFVGLLGFFLYGIAMALISSYASGIAI